MESGFEFGHVRQTPSIDVVEHTLIFAYVIGIFVEEGVGGGIDGIGDTKGCSNAFAKLSFAGP